MRRKQRFVSGVRKALLWKYGLIILVVVTLTVFYLWEQTQVIGCDVRIRNLKAAIGKVEKENDGLMIKVLSLAEGAKIVKQAEDELNMVYPLKEDLILIQHPGLQEPLSWEPQHTYRALLFTDSDESRTGTY